MKSLKKISKKLLVLIAMAFVSLTTLSVSTYAKPVEITTTSTMESNEGFSWGDNYAWCYTLYVGDLSSDIRLTTYINTLLYLGLNESYIEDNYGERVNYSIEIGWTNEYLSDPSNALNIEYFPFYERYYQSASEGIYLTSSTDLEYNVNISFANVYNTPGTYIYLYIVYPELFIDSLNGGIAYGSREIQIPYGSNESISIDYLNSRIEYLSSRVLELENQLNESSVVNSDLRLMYQNTLNSLSNLQLSYNALLERYNALANDSTELSFKELFWTISSTPFESFKTIWNVDFLGVNIASFAVGLLLVGLLIFIVKRIF